MTRVTSIEQYVNKQSQFAELAPMPTTVRETGLSESFLGDLVVKHLMDIGTVTLAVLSERLALPGKVVEELLNFLRGEARVEVLGARIHPAR